MKLRSMYIVTGLNYCSYTSNSKYGERIENQISNEIITIDCGKIGPIIYLHTCSFEIEQGPFYKVNKHFSLRDIKNAVMPLFDFAFNQH